jgi:hypothetical protein
MTFVLIEANPTNFFLLWTIQTLVRRLTDQKKCSGSLAQNDFMSMTDITLNALMNGDSTTNKPCHWHNLPNGSQVRCETRFSVKLHLPHYIGYW